MSEETGRQGSTREKQRRETEIIAALLTEVRVWRGLVLIFALLLVVALAVLRVGGCGPRGRQIVIDGQPLCIVRDERTAEAVRQRIIEEAKAGLESKGVIKEQWTVEMPRVLGEDEAVALLKQRVHVQVEAFAIQVDGKPVVFLPTEADAREVLEKARQRFCPEGVELLAKPEFREQVRIVQAVVDPAAVCRTQDEALKLLLGGGDRYYTVQAGDYPAKIAEKFGLTLKQFYALNPGKKGKDLRAGEKVLVARTKPRLTVVTVRKITVRKPIEPPEEVSPTPSLPAGERRVVTEGEPGEKLLVLKAVYENDQRVKAQVLESRVLKPPKPRKVMEGTGTAPQTPASPAGQARQ